MDGELITRGNRSPSFPLLVKKILEHPLCWPIQRARIQALLRQEITRLRGGSEATGFQALRYTTSPTLQRIHAEKTAFILGSGASVTDLTQAQFDEMSAFPTLGFGAWPLHSFVPSALAFGPTRGLGDYTRVFTEVMKREDIIHAKPEIFLLRSSLDEDLDMFSRLPREHWEQTQIYGRVSPVSRTVKGLKRELSFILSAQDRQSPAISLDSGSTLIRMMSMALRSGAHKIILVGVDMNTPEYFFERDPSYLLANGFDSFDTGQSGSVHDTLLAERRSFAVTEVVREMAVAFKDLMGGTIYTGSPDSALAEFLPTYRWASAKN